MVTSILNGTLNMAFALSIIYLYSYAIDPLSTLIVLARIYWFIT